MDGLVAMAWMIVSAVPQTPKPAESTIIPLFKSKIASSAEFHTFPLLTPTAGVPTASALDGWIGGMDCVLRWRVRLNAGEVVVHEKWDGRRAERVEKSGREMWEVVA